MFVKLILSQIIVGGTLAFLDALTYGVNILAVIESMSFCVRLGVW